MGHYLIRVEGSLSEEFVSNFPTLDSSRRQQTVLHGTIGDDSTLAEVLEHLRHIGVDVLDVHRVRPDGDSTSAPTQIGSSRTVG